MSKASKSEEGACADANVLVAHLNRSLLGVGSRNRRVFPRLQVLRNAAIEEPRSHQGRREGSGRSGTMNQNLP